jgi:cytoskeleton protein RodZ
MTEAENTSSNPISEAVADAKMSPGAQLAALRQQRGWTIEQVASQLNLAPRQIQALEDDHFAALPGMVIVRGFVRAYAKLLKTDPEPLIAAMSSEAKASQPESLELDRALAPAFSESSLPLHGAGRRATGRSLLLGALLIVLFSGGWLFYRFGDAKLARDWYASLSSQPVEAGNRAVDPPQQAPESETLRLNAVPPVSQAPASSEVPPQPAQARAMQDEAVAPEHALVLQFNEESWIEIRRAADQTPAVSRLVPAGKTEVFEVRQPSILVVGNATGVEARFRGEVLNLKANAKTNVARVELN